MENSETRLAKQLFLNAFASGSFFVVHKKLLFYYGPNIAIFITNLVDKHNYHSSKGTLKDGIWFYTTHEKQYLETGLSEKLIRSFKKRLREDGLITTKMAGLPAKEYYSFNWSMAINLINMADERYSEYLNSIGTKRVGQALTPGVGLDPAPEVGLINKNKESKNKLSLEDSQNNLKKRLFIESSLSAAENGKTISPKLFNSFWELYPKKTDKGKALTAWNKICAKKSDEKPLWSIIQNAVSRQKETDRWKSGFIPVATTWLNQSRWLDDPKEMQNWKKTTTSTDRKSGFVGTGKLSYKKTKTL